MTLNERKVHNYNQLNGILHELEDVLQEGYAMRYTGPGPLEKMLNLPVKDLHAIQNVIEPYIKYSDYVCRTDTGYSLSMIAPEAKNEEDPVMDVLKINVIMDILYAKSIIIDALLRLFPKGV